MSVFSNISLARKSMKKIVVVHGMKRSGNHAIINWLKAHDRFIFCNNVIPIAPVLNGKIVIPPPEEFTLWFQWQLITNKHNISQITNGHKLFPFFLKKIALQRYLPFFLKKIALQRYSPFFLKKINLQKYSMISSLEDHDLKLKTFLKPPCEVSNVLIMRDPYNMFSSRIRRASRIESPVYPKKSGSRMDEVIQLWKSHAREYLGLTNYLENKVCIHFDSWFSNRDYRKNISRKLNFEFTDNGFSEVSRAGGGSSFDGTEFNGNNKMMNVLNRHSHLKDSERQLLENIFADAELQEFAHKIRSQP
ncbi:MAG: hypothetical protein AAGF01_31615 [Cyanobacteria bacterium P01_G01_bin.38]